MRKHAAQLAAGTHIERDGENRSSSRGGEMSPAMRAMLFAIALPAFCVRKRESAKRSEQKYTSENIEKRDPRCSSTDLMSEGRWVALQE